MYEKKKTRYVNMEAQLEIPEICGTGLLASPSSPKDDLLRSIVRNWSPELAPSPPASDGREEAS